MKIDKGTKELLALIQTNDRERCTSITKYKSEIKLLKEAHDQSIRDLRRVVSDKDLEIGLLRASTSYKFGNACVRFAKRVTGHGASVARFKLPSALSRKSPRRLRAEYRSATESSPLLGTVRSPPPDWRTRYEVSEDARILWQTLQSRREKAPRVLDDFERDLLASFTESRSDGRLAQDKDLVRLIHSVRLGPARRGGASGPSDRVGKGRLLIDARTLQGGRLDGTARHGATVLESVLAHQDRWDGVTLLIDAAQQALPDSIAGAADQIGLDRVTPDLIARATAFLQLQPFHDLRHSDVVDELLAAPRVRTATVWLDAIMGTYPRHFLASPAGFFSHQWFIERLRHYDHVLALSDSARNEVVPLVAEAGRVIVTGCRNPLRSHLHQGQGGSCGASPETRVALFGNALPHKNLAAGLLAFAYAYFRYDDKLRLDVVANLSDEQVACARAVLASLDAALPSAVMFHRRLSDPRLAVLLGYCSASLVPSFHEGFSLPVLESFAFGVPVVASDIPTHRELLGPGYPLAPPDDPVALGRNLLRALDDPAALASRLKDAPVSRSEAQFAAGMASFLDSFSQRSLS